MLFLLHPVEYCCILFSYSRTVEYIRHMDIHIMQGRTINGAIEKMTNGINHISPRLQGESPSIPHPQGDGAIQQNVKSGLKESRKRIVSPPNKGKPIDIK
mmetsp:Transcript_12193/g.18503  ORF Transcript_12193/g.18503 Transcript_12193/m.18503 type:complete len:100 (+) Transcript_12193:1399-1698(+)